MKTYKASYSTLRHTFRHSLTACVLLLSLCSFPACSESELPVPALQLSDTEIQVCPVLDIVQDVTRAFIHDNGNLTDDRMRLYTYYSENGAEYFQRGLLYEDDFWVFFGNNIKGQKYFWPVNGKLHFFAHFPDDLSATGMAYAWNNGAPRLTYTGSSPITEAGQQDIKEVIFSYTKDCAPTDNGIVNLTFHRPFSQVVFKLAESIRCTIRSIKITGIKNEGTATCNTTEPWTTWTLSGADTNIEIDYAGNSAYSTLDGISYPQDINGDAELAKPFLMVPQSLPDAALIEITYAAEGSPRFSTAKSYLNKAMLTGASTAVTEWKPSNKYIYSLSLNGAADEIFVAVKVEDWIIEGETVTEVH